MAAACVSAEGTEADAVRKQAGVLQMQVKALRVSTDAPQLGKQLEALNAALDALAKSDKSVEGPVSKVRAASAALQASIRDAQNGGVKLGEKFCQDAAVKVERIAVDASDLANSNKGGPNFPAAFPPSAASANPEADAALKTGMEAAAAKIRARLASADNPNFDAGAAAGPGVAAAQPPVEPSMTPKIDGPVPMPRARDAFQDAAKKTKPAYSSQVSNYQEALSAVLKASHQGQIGVDGLFGPATDKAVRAFQKANDLTVNGVVDRDTESALLKKFQEVKKLPVTGALDAATQAALPKTHAKTAAASRKPATVKGQFFAGSNDDFNTTDKQKVIKGSLATIYTPYLAKTRAQKKMEGGPLDRHEQPICTMERYLAGSCPYVSVAIDPRLKVPNGTPLLIPEISAMVGRTVPFRIVDTGSTKRFKGTGHVDIATDSGDTAGLGSLISGGHFTLVLPRGL